MNKIILLFCLVNFSLFAQENNHLEITKSDSISKNEILKSAEEIKDIPIAPGCEFVENNKKTDCFNNYMKEHIIKHFKYPKKAARKNIQGEVIISFIINKEGNIEKIQTFGKHEILNEEARRIVSLLPKFEPGSINGIPKRVKFKFPITFRLTK